jgi:DHA3 family macrolide efflux protein-like MFS transporter
MRPYRTFLILTITQAFSLIGSRMTGIALGLWVFAETGDATPILLTAFFLEMPGLVGAGVSGVLADRWDRRRVIMLGDAGEALGTSLLMVSFLSGQFELWHLYAAAVVKGVFMTIQEPAADAAITMLVPDAHRDRANGIKEMAFPLAGVLAPVLTGFLFPLIDVTGIIVIDLATFGVAVIVVFLLDIPRPPQSAEGRAAQGGVWRELCGAVRFLAQRRALLGLVIYMTLTNFLLNGPLELSIPYVATVTGSERWVGVLMGVMSLGALAGATTMAAWGGTRPRIHTLLPGMALAGLMMVLYGMARAPLALGIVMFAVLFPLPVTNAVFTSILQVKTPPDMQGRVFGLVGQLAYVSAPLSFLLTAPLVDRLAEPAVRGPGWQWLAPLVGDAPGAGMGLVLAGAGALIVVASVVLYVLPAIRSLEISLPDYEPVPEIDGAWAET